MKNRAARSLKVRLLIGIMAMMLCGLFFLTDAYAVESKNLLLSPNANVRPANTADRFLNILLLGVDYGTTGYWGSGRKKTFEDCHTDSVLVVSLNLDKRKVDLVSVPRDTLTYIPHVKGIYKLNAAINCAESTEEGIRRVSDAVGWLLGGISIDKYYLVDMNAVIALGDAIGGVDFDLEMSYKGRDGRTYRKGMQHLDGQGIMDYIRARKNATVNANDVGRTGRNRKMMAAIFKKLRSDFSLIPKALAVVNAEKYHIFTNINQEDLQMLMQTSLTMDTRNIGSHVLTGKYMKALKGWNFTFTDQQHRLEVLKEVYGIEAEPIPYVSKQYTKWLEDVGFTYARSIFIAEKLLNHAKQVNGATAEQQALLDEFEPAYRHLITSFEQAADSMSAKDGRTLRDAGKQLKALGDKVAEAFRYPDQYSWKGGNYWYRDPLINGYPDIKWY